jgi:uncharacterized protein (DUF1684 family)
MSRRSIVSCLLSFLLIGVADLGARADDGYRAEIEQFRKDREARLKAEDGWLSVVGLHWLKPGESRLGSDPASDVLLPPRAPATVGTLELSGDRAVFRAAPGVKVIKAGQPLKEGEIRSDAQGKADLLTLGDGGIKLILLKRGERHALRVKDSRSEARTSFAGLRWFPIDESWIIKSKFIPSPSKTKLVFDNIVGEQDVSESPGSVEFERDGKAYRLQAATESDGSLWLVFRDGTSGRTTAGNARQLIVPAPKGDTVELDFNKAINLPCSYIPFATCPLAPRQNRLGLAITAGELKYEPGAAVLRAPDGVVE